MTGTIKISAEDSRSIQRALQQITDRGIRREAFRQAQEAIINKFNECINVHDYESEQKAIKVGINEALRIIGVIRVKNHF